MGNPFKRKKWKRITDHGKKAVRSVAKRAVVVHRVVDPVVTLALGYVFGAPGAIVGTGLSWVGTRAVGGAAARGYGMRGTDARGWARSQAKRTATYSAIAGGIGAVASLAVGGNFLGTSSQLFGAKAAAAPVASTAVTTGAATIPTTLPGGVNVVTGLTAQTAFNQAAVVSSIAAGNTTSLVGGATALAGTSAPLVANAAASAGLWGTLGKLGEGALGLAPTALDLYKKFFTKPTPPVEQPGAPPPNSGGSGGEGGSSNVDQSMGGMLKPATLALIAGGAAALYLLTRRKAS